MICDTCEKINRFCLPSTTEEKAIIEFCKKIPKTTGIDSKFAEDKEKYINLCANNFNDNGKNKNLEELDEKELKNALQNEMKVFRYLMSKHKNSRAFVFYNDIFFPTYDTLVNKLNNKLENKNYQENEKNEKYDKKNANDNRVKEQKEYFDKNIKKGLLTQEDINNLANNFQKTFKLEGNRRNKYLQDLCDGAELIKYAIDNHRHKRGINFTYVYEEIINDAINNVKAYKKGAQK